MGIKLAFFSHPRSGDVYACEYDLDNQRIIRAAGPVPQHDYEVLIPGTTSEYDYIELWLDNADRDDSRLDAVWLDAEIWPEDQDR